MSNCGVSTVIIRILNWCDWNSLKGVISKRRITYTIRINKQSMIVNAKQNYNL